MCSNASNGIKDDAAIAEDYYRDIILDPIVSATVKVQPWSVLRVDFSYLSRSVVAARSRVWDQISKIRVNLIKLMGKSM